MFKLNNASMGLRKAAWLVGVKSGHYEPVFDPQGGPQATVAIVRSAKAEKKIQQWQVTYAEAQSWEEIKSQ